LYNMMLLQQFMRAIAYALFPTSPIWCFSITLQVRKPRRQRTAALCVQHSPTAAVL